MSLKGFRTVAILSTTMGLMVAVFAVAETSVHFMVPNSSGFTISALIPLTLSFGAISALARMALSTFKAQAEQIERLELRIADVRS